jgi:hypothetical protein
MSIASSRVSVVGNVAQLASVQFSQYLSENVDRSNISFPQYGQAGNSGSLGSKQDLILSISKKPS